MIYFQSVPLQMAPFVKICFLSISLLLHGYSSVRGIELMHTDRYVLETELKAVPSSL